MCILIFSTTLSESFPIRRRIQRDIFINVHTSSCTVPALRFFFFRNWIFSTDFLKAPKYKILLRRTTLLPLLIAPSERPPEEKQYTHTHTHIYIYIYIYISNLLIQERSPFISKVPRSIITVWKGEHPSSSSSFLLLTEAYKLSTS